MIAHTKQGKLISDYGYTVPSLNIRTFHQTFLIRESKDY
jgi:hypothetical protein